MILVGTRKAWFTEEGKLLLVFLFLFFFATLTFAYDGKQEPDVSNKMPDELSGVGIDEKLGHQLDLSLTFRNEAGKTVRLSDYYDGKKPVIISLVYFGCPGLCNFHLNGLVEGLKQVDWSSGEKFQVLAISFDTKETPELAVTKKKSYLEMYNRLGADQGWHFLTASKDSIEKLTNAVGFKYKWNAENEEWSHASAAIITTPNGTISRYLGGIVFDPKDLKLALNEAAEGKIGNFIDKMLLYCFHYDTKTNTYALAAFNIVRMGGVVIVILLMIWLIPYWIKNLKREETTGS